MYVYVCIYIHICIYMFIMPVFVYAYMGFLFECVYLGIAFRNKNDFVLIIQSCTYRKRKKTFRKKISKCILCYSQ